MEPKKNISIFQGFDTLKNKIKDQVVKLRIQIQCTLMSIIHGIQDK